MQLIRFIALLMVMGFFAMFVPFGHVINGMITAVALWKLASD